MLVLQHFKNSTVHDKGIIPQTTEILSSQTEDRPKFHSVTASFLNTGGCMVWVFLVNPKFGMRAHRNQQVRFTVLMLVVLLSLWKAVCPQSMLELNNHRTLEDLVLQLAQSWWNFSWQLIIWVFGECGLEAKSRDNLLIWCLVCPTCIACSRQHTWLS